MDASETVLEEARKNTKGSNIEIGKGDIYDLQFPNQSFDIVHCHQG